MPAAVSSATVSARARPIPGAAWLSVRGVRTGSAAENGTSHRSLAAVPAVSLRQNRSKSSAPRLPVSAVRSQPASTAQAAETSTGRPSLAVAAPPGRAAQAFAASAAARSPAGTRFANCCSCRSVTVSPPLAAIAATSCSAPRVRSERVVPRVPQIRSYPVSGRSALASQALSLEFSAYGASRSVGAFPGPNTPGCTASGSEPSAQSPRAPSRTASPDAGYVARPSGVEQRAASSSVIRGSTWDWVNSVPPAESAATVLTQGRPCVRCSASWIPATVRALPMARAVSEPRRFAAFGSFRAYAVPAVQGSGRPGPRPVITGP